MSPQAAPAPPQGAGAGPRPFLVPPPAPLLPVAAAAFASSVGEATTAAGGRAPKESFAHRPVYQPHQFRRVRSSA